MKNGFDKDILSKLVEFNEKINLTQRIGKVENDLVNKSKHEVSTLIEDNNYSKEFLDAALQVKSIAGQINVLIHYYGIVMMLPYILDEDEIIEEVSLGAGNTGKDFDLITNKRIAEFKFIHWKGHDTIRQNNTFKDFFLLAEEETFKRKCLYVLDKFYFLKFLKGGRNLKSVLSKNDSLKKRFFNKYGNKYDVVSDYFNENKYKVEIIDLMEVAPMLWK